MRVVVIEHISLDGVIQAPGRTDEDTRGGFTHGGWVPALDDPAIGAAMGAAMGPEFAWLFGHRSYDDMLTHWNAAGGPFKDGLNGAQKYVASADLEAQLPWPNSTLLAGDAPAEVRRLRTQPGGNLVVLGSGELVRSLIPHGLVDELLLLVHPLLLGSGQRLFGADAEQGIRRFELISAEPTASGVLLASYRAAG